MYCLMRTGAMLSSEICDYLYHMARAMYGKGETQRIFTDEFCEGRMTTSGQRTVMGSTPGVVFTAEIDYADGSTTIRFLVASPDLPVPKEAKWYERSGDGTMTPLDEMWN